jgi:hypothetical protein
VCGCRGKKGTKNKQTPWSESDSELYRPSDSRLSAKWLPTFADRGCHVVRVTDRKKRVKTKEKYKLSYNYINCTINLVGRSFGKWRRRRLCSGGSRRVRRRSFGCAVRQAESGETDEQRDYHCIGHQGNCSQRIPLLWRLTAIAWKCAMTSPRTLATKELALASQQHFLLHQGILEPQTTWLSSPPTLRFSLFPTEGKTEKTQFLHNRDDRGGAEHPHWTQLPRRI